ncbi:MAG: IS607 family transposase [Gammaproteobacteria bacterium]|nr:IS607 family transposase [Gammaproteobacteria bacterium]
MSKIYRINEFAARIGKSAKTLRRWDKTGVLKAKRHPSGHRYYDESDIRRIFGYEEKNRKNIVYCRVSGAGQKDDLRSQVAAMEQFCLARGTSVDEWIEEIGDGMNFKRKKFLSIMSRIQAGEICTLAVAHKDRLSRFGFEWFEHMAKENGCEIVVANQPSLSPRQEVVEDLMAVIHTFSCRLYGLRKHEKTIKKMLNEQNGE